MEEVQSNQNNVTPEGFTNRVTGAIFPNHGEMEFLGAGGSSPRTGRISKIARRPWHMRFPLYDTARLGSNQLGVGFHGNDMFDDDRSLSSAFRNMSLSFRDGGGGGEALANPGNVAFRNGYCPEDILIPSASSTVNTLHQVSPAKDRFMDSSLNINDLEHLKPNSGVWNCPMYTGIHGSDDASWTLGNLPSFSPLQKRLFDDVQPPSYPPYQQMDSRCKWQDTDTEGYSLLQSPYAYRKMPQVGSSDVLWSRSNYSTTEAASSSLRTPSVDQLGHHGADTYWNLTVNPNGNSEMSSEFLNNCPGCSCGNCEYCHIQQAEKLDQYGIRCSSNVSLRSSPANINMKPESISSVRNIKSGLTHDGCAKTNRGNNQRGRNNNVNQSIDPIRFDWKGSESESLSSLEPVNDFVMKTQWKDSSLDEDGENIYLLAKDPRGCHFLQKRFNIGAPEYVTKVFYGIIGHISELMVDPFGNYLVQKLLEECNSYQKMHIINEITKTPGQLIEVSCNMHGTSVVQKVIETINSREEASMIVYALSPGAGTLMMDVNGYHVAHHCLKNLPPEYTKFLLDAAIQSYFELAQDCYGCCMIQKCIDHANKDQKDKLLYNITSKALDLSQHQYGNYLVHYIIGLKIMWATDKILDKLEGHYGYLSMQKCSSHVVEKCLKEAHEPKRVEIIHELINDPSLIHILLDQYGNYVIQTALKECKKNAAAHAALVRAIRTHAADLRNNKYGKCILSKIHRKNRE